MYSYLELLSDYNLFIVLSYLFSSLTLALGCLYSGKILQELLLNNVMRWSMELFDTTPLGRIVNRFSKDIDVLDNTLPLLWRSVISTSFSVNFSKLS